MALAICFTGSAFAQSAYTPGTSYQSTNPNYPARNPFYFEGRIDWDLLKITQPSNAWEYAQRGIYKQDDLEDIVGAIADYRTSVSMNNLANGTCQLIIATATGFGQKVDPPPCMFTVRLRLGNLLKEESPAEALALFKEVLNIDPLRLGVNSLIGETYTKMADGIDPLAKDETLKQAVAAFQAELALSPVTTLTKSLTGDEANNAHVHWALADVFQELGDNNAAAGEIVSYLKATKWHSDTYAWRIQLAQARLAKLRATANTKPGHR
jgi:tetratricopeptide (TPR) repeat protein